jgi:hypothetical protein
MPKRLAGVKCFVALRAKACAPGPEGVDERTRKAVGGLLLALISGMTMQQLLDPDGAPTAEDLTLAMQTMASLFAPESPATRLRASGQAAPADSGRAR